MSDEPSEGEANAPPSGRQYRTPKPTKRKARGKRSQRFRSVPQVRRTRMLSSQFSQLNIILKRYKVEQQQSERRRKLQEKYEKKFDRFNKTRTQRLEAKKSAIRVNRRRFREDSMRRKYLSERASHERREQFYQNKDKWKRPVGEMTNESLAQKSANKKLNISSHITVKKRREMLEQENATRREFLEKRKKAFISGIQNRRNKEEEDLRNIKRRNKSLTARRVLEKRKQLEAERMQKLIKKRKMEEIKTLYAEKKKHELIMVERQKRRIERIAKQRRLAAKKVEDERRNQIMHEELEKQKLRDKEAENFARKLIEQEEEVKYLIERAQIALNQGLFDDLGKVQKLVAKLAKKPDDESLRLLKKELKTFITHVSPSKTKRGKIYSGVTAKRRTRVPVVARRKKKSVRKKRRKKKELIPHVPVRKIVKKKKKRKKRRGVGKKKTFTKRKKTPDRVRMTDAEFIEQYSPPGAPINKKLIDNFVGGGGNYSSDEEGVRIQHTYSENQELIKRHMASMRRVPKAISGGSANGVVTRKKVKKAGLSKLEANLLIEAGNKNENVQQPSVSSVEMVDNFIPEDPSGTGNTNAVTTLLDDVY